MPRAIRGLQKLVPSLLVAGALLLQGASFNKSSNAQSTTSSAASSTAATAADDVSVLAFGAVADTRTDNRRALQAAFDFAAERKRPVVVPEGQFGYSGTLRAVGISLRGAGPSSILRAMDGSNEAIELSGTNVSVADLMLSGAGSKRLSTPESAMIWVRAAENFSISNVLIRRSASVGIMVDGSSRGQILDNIIEQTLADSIHLVNGTHDVTVRGNRIRDSGDDGISAVSYDDKPIVHDISIVGNSVSRNTWGRGISVVGGHNIQIVQNRVEGGRADRAGIYIAAEKQWRTRGVRSVMVSKNLLIDAGGHNSGHGAITVYNSYSLDPVIDGITISDNVIEVPRAAAILVTGSGVQKVEIVRNRACQINGGELIKNEGAKSTLMTNLNTRDVDRCSVQ